VDWSLDSIMEWKIVCKIGGIFSGNYGAFTGLILTTVVLRKYMGCAKLLPQKEHWYYFFLLLSLQCTDGELTTSSNVKSLLLSNLA